jgi:hypothetical protein
MRRPFWDGVESKSSNSNDTTAQEVPLCQFHVREPQICSHRWSRNESDFCGGQSQSVRGALSVDIGDYQDFALGSNPIFTDWGASGQDTRGEFPEN